LKLDWKHILALRSSLGSKEFIGVLKFVIEMKVALDGDVSEMPIVLNEILHKAPNLIEMIIYNCNRREIFLTQSPKKGEDGMLLRILTLSNVSTIRSIQTQNSSWLNTICEKVHQLNVCRCPCVETIGVHSTSRMSFSFLKKVVVQGCPRLQYLFTSSVAKKLVNLKEIIVKECESLKEIVAKEEDEDKPKGKGEHKYENKMIFMKLENLTLISLDKIERFYTGSSTLNFPCLKIVRFDKCFRTKLFRRCDIISSEVSVVIDENLPYKGYTKALIMQK